MYVQLIFLLSQSQRMCYSPSTVKLLPGTRSEVYDHHQRSGTSSYSHCKFKMGLLETMNEVTVVTRVSGFQPDLQTGVTIEI